MAIPREERLSRKRARNAKNSEARNADHKKWYAANADGQRAARRTVYASNKEGGRAVRAQYRIEHPDRVRAADRAYHASHKDADHAYARAYYAAHKDELRDTYLIRKYGISALEYATLLKSQGGVCKICGSPKAAGQGSRFQVDHDHKTGEVRGLLCNRCNVGLGSFLDDRSLLESAVLYLRRAV